MMSCVAVRAGGKAKKEEGYLELASQLTVVHNEAQFSWERLNIFLQMGSNK